MKLQKSFKASIKGKDYYNVDVKCDCGTKFTIVSVCQNVKDNLVGEKCPGCKKEIKKFF